MIGILLLAGCRALSLAPASPAALSDALTPSIQPTPTGVEAGTPAPPLAPTPTPTPLPDTGWVPLREGLERREIHLLDADGRTQEIVYILRVDPAHYRFELGYRPGSPQWMPDWQAETDALILTNAGFFTEAFEATGRIVVDGQGSGTSYADFAGMVVMSDTGVEVRWLGQRPYDPHEALEDAFQSFPMLVRPGGGLGFPAEREDGRRARRSAIGRDVAGHVLLIVTPVGHFTLHELSRYLTEGDLNLDVALNLDGGPSAGVWSGALEEGYPAFSQLPAVIAVYAR